MYKYLILNHIPRCGGSSLKLGIYNAVRNNKYFQQAPYYISQYSHANICLYEKPHLIEAIHPETLLFADHSPAFYIEDQFKIDISMAYRILTIRNPVSRIISHIHFFYNKHINDLSEAVLNNYLNRFGHITIDYLTNYLNSQKSLNDRFKLAKSVIKKYHFIFQVEKQKLCETFNDTNPFELHIENHHANTSPIDSLLEVDQNIKNIIYDHSKLEVKLLEDYYEMDL
jgi:hypothetical protein